MDKSTHHITKETNYATKRSIASLSKYKESLDKFSENFSKETSLDTETPIFLDTNILLRYYSISFTAREKLFEFIQKNIKRIILSSQVQLEFIKNREDVIQRFFEQVTNKIPREFNSDVVNKMKNFLDQYKVVLKDYPFVETGIQKHRNDLEALLQKLNENAELKRKEFKDLIIKDKFLDLLSTCTLIDPLLDEEYDIIKKDFDNLSKGITKDNIDSTINKPGGAFPGLGDIKEKPEDPYGDFVIFHELMKYMIQNESDVIFLTFDNTKGDWMNKSKSPHLHYVQNMYLNTKHILYILDAERTLGEILNVDIESLVNTTNITSTSITETNLIRLVDSHNLFKDVSPGNFSNKIIEELTVNGYDCIEQIHEDLNKAAKAILLYKQIDGPALNKLGLLRAGLKIANNSYNKQVNKDGTILTLRPEFLLRYRKYDDII